MEDNKPLRSLYLLMVIVFIALPHSEVTFANSQIMEGFYYVTPEASVSGFTGIIVGTENNYDLLIIANSHLKRYSLSGVEIPQYDSTDSNSKKCLNLIRNTIGLEAIVHEVTTSKEASAYVWILLDGEAYLIQSIIVSSGLSKAVDGGEIELVPAEEFARERSLGIWAEEPEVLESGIEETSQREAIEEVVEEDSRGAARLTISKIDIFDNGEHALLTLAADKGGYLEGSEVSILSRADRTTDEDVFSLDSQDPIETAEELRILITLDRSRTTSFEYDFLWESYLDPRGGYLKIKDENGRERLFEYEYDRRISGFTVTPLD
ncbi:MULTISPECIES: hypothetical protein [Mesotoga]|uniref:hypothetical protein n=1 Tax=Mesotoga TaxID=1184396 RepID=UPI001BD46574|nr:MULTISPECIES: hypothetical protein [Mesotoga]MCP5456417.1 hypothetical protein [Thermotogota bacterium]MCB1222358.1 hypothetical protein [Mesotoga sp.]MCP5460859.1 hypothetical protein [Thermotogota bacterium]HNQ70238.1 hypothetical protein [Mesotoga prima]HNS74689.1 hypothetical protein [Mesotoga prima]